MAVVQVSNLSIQEVEAEGPRVQEPPRLQCETLNKAKAEASVNAERLSSLGKALGSLQRGTNHDNGNTLYNIHISV